MIKFEIDNDEEKAAKEFIQQHSESCKVCKLLDLLKS